MQAAIGPGPCIVEKAVPQLFARCIQSVENEEARENYRPIPVEDCPSNLLEQISRRMAEVDAQAEIALHLVCPVCGQQFQSMLDMTDYLLQELEKREQQLYGEVHQLALAYHWSEKDILAMPARRRKLYLDMLAGEGLA